MNGCKLIGGAVDPRPSTDPKSNRYETAVHTESLLEDSYDHSIAIPVELAVRGIKRDGIDAFGRVTNPFELAVELLDKRVADHTFRMKSGAISEY